MIPLADLWLPILLAAVAVWIVSALAWTLFPHHHRDFDKLPDEAAFCAQLKALNIGPGNYGFPNAADCKGGNKEEMQRRWKEGPIGWLTIMPTPLNMGRNMILSFLVYLAVSLFIAYAGAITLPRGTGFATVFRVLGAAGVAAYAFASLPHGIWFGSKPRALLMCMLDGIAYGLATGAVFAALWPSATPAA